MSDFYTRKVQLKENHGSHMYIKISPMQDLPIIVIDMLILKTYRLSWLRCRPQRHCWRSFSAHMPSWEKEMHFSG